jgi:1-deoxy-D-xylulose-5-phosphate reductoisomerase
MHATMVPKNQTSPTGPKRLALLGSTGSIGQQTLEVLETLEGFDVCALAAGSNWQLLGRQVRQFQPQLAALSQAPPDSFAAGLPEACRFLQGQEAMTDMIRLARPDVVVSAVVGAAGLAPTLAAIEAGADIALANKETLVAAGQIVLPAARRAGIDLLPVDSEHSGVFQCLAGAKHEQIDKVVLTASGGALRDWDEADLASATVDDALNHPTWQMGSKITVDSATLINKALEVIEAHWLFDLPAEKIEVLLHPESTVHAMVHYRDGSVLAQMGPPDMRTPIAYALSYPDRTNRPGRPLDLAQMGQLTFRKPEGRFARAIDLAYRVIRQGGTSGAVLNAANEQAVQAFLQRKISFAQIVQLVENTLNRARGPEEVTLESLHQADAWARQDVSRQLREAPSAPSTVTKPE